MEEEGRERGTEGGWLLKRKLNSFEGKRSVGGGDGVEKEKNRCLTSLSSLFLILSPFLWIRAVDFRRILSSFFLTLSLFTFTFFTLSLSLLFQSLQMTEDLLCKMKRKVYHGQVLSHFLFGSFRLSRVLLQ